MKAVTFQGPGKVDVGDVPDPAVQEPGDAVLKVTASGICGTDLHVYDGRIPFPITGWVMGHEYAGEVVEVGEAVRRFQPGDRVIGAPVASCGECYYCERGWPNQCFHQQHFGAGMIPGAQAQYLRVPFADHTLELVPEALTDERAILAGDVLPTGYFAAERGEIAPGDVVAVVGSGPVGLCAQMCARLFEPAVVIAIDSVAERLALAGKLGSLTADVGALDPMSVIAEYTGGRGADVVLEAVGTEASLRSCFRYVRPGGTISAVGVYSEAEFPFPMFKSYLHDLTFRIGACPVKNYMSKLLGLIEGGKLDPSQIITHDLPLADASRGYDIFAGRRDGCVKALLRPWAD